jgi:hypothetical protein
MGAFLCGAQVPQPGPHEAAAIPERAGPSWWWVHGPVLAHMSAAALDGFSSWKQGEANSLYVQESGPQEGHFYRTGAARLTGATLGIAAASYFVGWVHPGWRKYVGVFNLSCAGAHLGTVVYNVVQNPYYR